MEENGQRKVVVVESGRGINGGRPPPIHSVNWNIWTVAAGSAWGSRDKLVKGQAVVGKPHFI